MYASIGENIGQLIRRCTSIIEIQDYWMAKTNVKLTLQGFERPEEKLAKKRKKQNFWEQVQLDIPVINKEVIKE